jgi:hypothetical protein
VARQAARLDVDDGMEEPECLFAHGFFRRTGEAGSVDRRRRDPSARRGPATDPDDPPTSWASRRQGCEPCHGTVPAPTLRRLASAPLSEAGLRNDIAQLTAAVKNKVRTLSLTHLPRHPRACPGDPDDMRRRACPDRDGRDRPGHDEGEDQDGERARTRKGSGRVIPGRASARARKPSPLTMQNRT